MFPFFPFSFCQISLLVLVTNPSFFELQPTIQEHEELVWLTGNLTLEVPNYLRSLYDPGGMAYLGDCDDDDDGGDDDGGDDGDEGTRRLLLAIDQGRGSIIDYL